MDQIPDYLSRALVIATYQASVVEKRNLMRFLFAMVSESRPTYESLRNVVRGWTQGQWLDFGVDESMREIVVERDAHRASYQDAAAALVSIAAASVERLYETLRESLFTRGVMSYAPGIHFSRAIWVLAIHYRHLGKWTHGTGSNEGRADVKALVDDPLRADAAAEFLTRCAFASYDDFETALLSCVGDLTGPSIVPTGDSGIPSAAVRAVVEAAGSDAGA